MAFLNIPLKAVQAGLISVAGQATMPWYNPSEFPVQPGNPTPTPILKDYRWTIDLTIDIQTQSSSITRAPGQYNGQDISVGMWMANVTTGQAWQIIKINAKTENSVNCVIQDVYRYNTYRDVAGSGNGGPSFGTYVLFSIGSTGIPEIDPIPSGGISSTFSMNIQSRFQYVNLQFDYPLYQEGNDFALHDIIAADATTNRFVKSDSINRIVVGRVTSISDTIPGWFTINPVQKVTDYLDYLPGDIGDIIYADLFVPGGITTTPGGPQLYIKLRNNTSSVSVNTVTNGITTPGSVFQINRVDVIVGGTGTLSDVATACNLVSLQTGVNAALAVSDNVIQTNTAQITPTYGEIALWASTAPATSSINGVPVTFDITSTDPGYEDYARPQQMAQAINDAAIPGIVATTPGGTVLQITNIAGGSITIVNITPDTNGVVFAGVESASGLSLDNPASTSNQIKFAAIDARAIDFLDVVGTAVGDVGLVSVENGDKAAGLYIEEGLRTATSTVVTNLIQLNALSPLIGDQAYVINSVDSDGNNAGEWSLWLFDGTSWIQTSNQDSASTDAKSLEYTLTTTAPALINIGSISTGRRITLITVEVTESFDSAATLNIGYQVSNPALPSPVTNGLMAAELLDLTITGTYATSTDILFGIDTLQGDVNITASFSVNGSTTGSAQIIVSYV